MRFEVGQVVAEGQPVISIADQGEPEIVVDVPEDHLAAFKDSRFQASLASSPGETFDVVLRELSPQAAQQTRTYRARLKPETPRAMPLGATATLVVDRAVEGTPVAAIPASAITQAGGKPAVWVVRHTGPSRSELSTWSALPCTDTVTTRCSFPARRPATSSSRRACRRCRPGCVLRCRAALTVSPGAAK